MRTHGQVTLWQVLIFTWLQLSWGAKQQCTPVGYCRDGLGSPAVVPGGDIPASCPRSSSASAHLHGAGGSGAGDPPPPMAEAMLISI